MADDPCRGIRAQTESLEEELALMRGVVAALRSSRVAAAPSRARARHPEQRRWKIVVAAFLAGTVVGAATLILLTRYP